MKFELTWKKSAGRTLVISITARSMESAIRAGGIEMSRRHTGKRYRLIKAEVVDEGTDSFFVPIGETTSILSPAGRGLLFTVEKMAGR